ncbi:von Hippel-Lindau disease tumor suppressor-like [Saccostrea echinata]|uniref:von Hippel-Lindau disease tumor suppressor-like n=1 Tax=Saccostrea echinata TaxID=191078 RepID=UPI002A819B54|nr:von Hippel-Lindau disease tumor suppressor-like [Saccostrea echinata]
MAGNQDEDVGKSTKEEGSKEPRSLNNDIVTYVRFKNRCDRIATLFWFNFKGNLVRYSILKKGEFIDMNTYVTHPWCARETVTNDRLVIDKQRVFYPAEGEDLTYKLVYIDIPVYSLRERCKQIIWKAYPDTDPKTLDIPRVLTKELDTKKSVSYTDYEGFHQT